MKLRERQKKQGSILILTLFFMMMISFFAIAYWKLIPVDLHTAQRHKDDTRCYYASDAGVVDTLGFLGHRSTEGNIDQIFLSSGEYDSEGNRIFTRDGTLDGIRWDVTITPGPLTQGHKDFSSQNANRVYKIESVSSIGGKKYRSISAWASQGTFAGKNWLVNKGASGTVLWLNFDSFRLGGDYHTNDILRFNIPRASFWTTSDPAAVGGKLTSSKNYTNGSGNVIGDGVEYNNWNTEFLPYDASVNAVPGRYEKISAFGETGVQAGAKELTLPVSTDSVAQGAWGDSVLPDPVVALPSSDAIFGADGVNIRVRSRDSDALPGGDALNGLYIEGPVDQIDLEVVNNNQRIRIDQGPHEVEVTFVHGETGGVPNSFTIPSGATVEGATPGQTLSAAANDERGFTVIRRAGTNEYKVYTDQTNGVIYATGNINGIRGTTKGRRTVATLSGSGDSPTEMGKDKRITITGELLYADTPRGVAPDVNGKNQLGLISYAVKMGSAQADFAPNPNGDNQDGKMWPKRNSRSAADPHYLYCSIFAGRNDDPRTNTIDSGGFGVNGYDDSTLGAGSMKMFGSLSEGVRLAKGTFNSSTGLGSSGYQYSFQNDPSLKQVQPPYFPGLPTFFVVSWEEKSVFAY